MRASAERIRKPVKMILSGIVAVCLLLSTGCMEEELGEKVLVNMVGIDRNDAGKIKVTLGLISTRKIQLQKDEVVMIYSSEGETIFDAIRHLVQKTGFRPIWPYIRVLIVGPSISEKDVTPVLDFFTRNNEIQPNPYVVFTHLPASEIVNLKTDLEILPALIVEQQIDKQNLLSTTPQVKLYNFAEMMFSSDKVGFATIIKKEKEENKFVPMVEGTAVVKGGKWIGDLNERQTRGVLWARSEVKGGIVVIPFEVPGKAEAKIALEILKGEAKIKPKLTNGQLSATIEIDSTLAIGEIFGYSPMSLTSLKEIKLGAAKEIREEVEASMKILQKKWNVDIYGIDNAVHKKYPEYWRKNKDNWDSIYSDLPIEVIVTADVNKMGLFQSFNRK